MTAGGESAAGARRILVVEDEMLVVMQLEDTLEDLGYRVVGPASRVSTALDIVQAETIDAAILDVNIAGEKVFPVADMLAARGIPFAFLTGYGASGVLGRYAERPVLQKPYHPSHLGDLLARLVSRSRSGP